MSYNTTQNRIDRHHVRVHARARRKRTPRVILDQSKRGNFPTTRARRLEARGGGDSRGRRDAPTAHVDATIEGGLDDARDRIV